MLKIKSSFSQRPIYIITAISLILNNSWASYRSNVRDEFIGPVNNPRNHIPGSRELLNHQPPSNNRQYPSSARSQIDELYERARKESLNPGSPLYKEITKDKDHDLIKTLINLSEEELLKERRNDIAKLEKLSRFYKIAIDGNSQFIKEKIHNEDLLNYHTITDQKLLKMRALVQLAKAEPSPRRKGELFREILGDDDQKIGLYLQKISKCRAVNRDSATLFILAVSDWYTQINDPKNRKFANDNLKKVSLDEIIKNIENKNIRISEHLYAQVAWRAASEDKLEYANKYFEEAMDEHEYAKDYYQFCKKYNQNVSDKGIKNLVLLEQKNDREATLYLDELKEKSEYTQKVLDYRTSWKEKIIPQVVVVSIAGAAIYLTADKAKDIGARLWEILIGIVIK
jgi:hypothetical protein